MSQAVFFSRPDFVGAGPKAVGRFKSNPRNRLKIQEPVQSVGSLNPRPLKIVGTHLSARAVRVLACFAPET